MWLWIGVINTAIVRHHHTLHHLLMLLHQCLLLLLFIDLIALLCAHVHDHGHPFTVAKINLQFIFTGLNVGLLLLELCS